MSIVQNAAKQQIFQCLHQLHSLARNQTFSPTVITAVFFYDEHPQRPSLIHTAWLLSIEPRDDGTARITFDASEGGSPLQVTRIQFELNWASVLETRGGHLSLDRQLTLVEAACMKLCGIPIDTQSPIAGGTSSPLIEVAMGLRECTRKFFHGKIAELAFRNEVRIRINLPSAFKERTVDLCASLLQKGSTQAPWNHLQISLEMGSKEEGWAVRLNAGLGVTPTLPTLEGKPDLEMVRVVLDVLLNTGDLEICLVKPLTAAAPEEKSQVALTSREALAAQTMYPEEVALAIVAFVTEKKSHTLELSVAGETNTFSGKQLPILKKLIIDRFRKEMKKPNNPEGITPLLLDTLVGNIEINEPGTFLFSPPDTAGVVLSEDWIEFKVKTEGISEEDAWRQGAGLALQTYYSGEVPDSVGFGQDLADPYSVCFYRKTPQL